MKRILTLVAALLLPSALLAQQKILVEAEQFASYGGWSLDQQFMEQMGSAYLLAHGMGVPVADAETEVDIPRGGRYHVYVRTYNWTAPFQRGEGPGKFCVRIGGEELGPVGHTGVLWEWQHVGSVRLPKGKAPLALHDLTGFEGRCDAVLLSRKFLEPWECMPPHLSFATPEIQEACTFDFVVIGGGYSGICAAVAAARQGLKVALVQDRAVLGGNNSSEIRVQLGGALDCGPYPNLGNLLKEFAPTEKGNAMPPSYYGDDAKMQIVRNEKNISLFLLTKVLQVEHMGENPKWAVGTVLSNRPIEAVVGRNVVTGERLRFRAPLFADCTGDGTVGFLAGAAYRVGRESRAEYGEASAPEQADKMVLGASLQWSSRKDAVPSAFPEFSYGIELDEDSYQKMTKGSWTWETGMFKDQIREAEQIRDYGMLAIYANWSYLKNHAACRAEFAKRSLEWVSFNSGKRESRRLVGDVVLTQNHLEHNVYFPDATCSASWSIDIHYPEPENHRYFARREAEVAAAKASAADEALSPEELAAATGFDGFELNKEQVQAVARVAQSRFVVVTGGPGTGKTTVVCAMLRALMARGAGDPSAPNLQLTNIGRNAHHFFEKPLVLRETPAHDPGPALRVGEGAYAADYVFVEGGTFAMGSDGRSEYPFAAELPVHDVTLSSYYIGRHEVTNGLWKAVMGADANLKASEATDDRCPVLRRTRAEIAVFCQRLGALTGRSFRLPTEAEWEYAARGGRLSKGYLYSGSDDWADVAWINRTSGGVVHPVGTKLPNELGIYDMSGNAWELCSDLYGPYAAGPATDPSGAETGAYAVVRGGGIFGGTVSCRVTYRSFDAPQSNLIINGFRLVMDL